MALRSLRQQAQRLAQRRERSCRFDACAGQLALGLGGVLLHAQARGPVGLAQGKGLGHEAARGARQLGMAGHGLVLRRGSTRARLGGLNVGRQALAFALGAGFQLQRLGQRRRFACLGAHTRTQQQRMLLDMWLDSTPAPLVIEIGAGRAVPTVRNFTRRMQLRGSALVRINLYEANIHNPKDIELALGAKDALEQIASHLQPSLWQC